MAPRCKLFCVLAVALLAIPSRAQVANEFDFDRSQRPLTTITPSGTHVVSAREIHVAQNLRLSGNLRVQAGGELILLDSILTIHGNVLLERGGRITVVDSSFLLAPTYAGQFELRNDGGLIHTERAVFGSAFVNGFVHQSAFLHLRGTWLARHTVFQGLIALLGNGQLGYEGNPALRGGSVFATGLYEGNRADAIHMCGMSDAFLADGTMNVGLWFDVTGATTPSTSVVEPHASVAMTEVFGVPALHEGVTLPVANAFFRLAMNNHRSAWWQMLVAGITTSGPRQTFLLRNAKDLLLGLKIHDLTGTPTLVGPWSSHYAQLPGLPSTARPGYHRMPPSCGVDVGNVSFLSGPGAQDWNSIYGWGFYTTGASTNFSVTGPSQIGEVVMYEGQLHLAGTGSFDMGVVGNVVRLFGNSVLTIDNAALGDFSKFAGSVGLFEASGSSQCTVTRARTAQLLLRTIGAGSIQASNLFGTRSIDIDTSAGGTIDLNPASPAQDHDLRNLGLDVAGPGVPHWSYQGLSGALVTDNAPASPLPGSRELTIQSTPATLRKTWQLPPETLVTASVSTKMLQTGGGAQLRIAQGTNVVSAPISSATNSWQRTLAPLFTVGSGAPTTLELRANNATNLRIDDAHVLIGSWWDIDNLSNLGFEGQYRDRGQATNPTVSPDGWWAVHCTCEPDAVAIRPGAAAGTRSVFATARHGAASLKKELKCFRPGDVINVSGWARCSSPSGFLQPEVGNGDYWYLHPNQRVVIPADGTWRSFSLTYTCPSDLSYVSLTLSCYAPVGTQFWYDDISVTLL